MYSMWRFTLLIIFAGQFNSVFSQYINYQEIFGDDWKKAVTFEIENRNWMEPVLTKNNISYPFAIAVIFPELVRYSALRDKMEITLLKALYINLGDEYANFSIGVFQMKPSFASFIREQSPTLANINSFSGFKSSSEYSDITWYRKSIVTDLENPETQLLYLVAFLKLCEKKYNTSLKNDSDRLKFISTAYNFGINKSSEKIDSMINKKFFNTKLFRTKNYSYSDISLFWYKQNRKLR
jgi:hypothetical protein